MNDDRLVELEIKILRQEDMLDSLNQAVYRQQKQIEHLETICTTLAKHIKQVSDANTGSLENERPPHY